MVMLLLLRFRGWLGAAFIVTRSERTNARRCQTRKQLNFNSTPSSGGSTAVRLLFLPIVTVYGSCSNQHLWRLQHLAHVVAGLWLRLGALRRLAQQATWKTGLMNMSTWLHGKCIMQCYMVVVSKVGPQSRVIQNAPTAPESRLRLTHDWCVHHCLLADEPIYFQQSIACSTLQHLPRRFLALAS